MIQEAVEFQDENGDDEANTETKKVLEIRRSIT